MAIKFLILGALVATVNAGVIVTPAAVYPAPVVHQAPVALAKTKTIKVAKVPVVEDADFDPNPSYSFSYDIHDDTTGDSKSRTESLENGVVRGSYSLVYPDGIRRTVEYTADDVNGFNAVINAEPSKVVIKTPVVKTVAPVHVVPAKAAVVATPAVHQVPLAYHAPVTKVISAPLAKLVSYSTPHVAYHHAPIAFSAAPVHHKVFYA